METREIEITHIISEKESWAAVTAKDSEGNTGTYAGKLINIFEGMKLIVTGEPTTHKVYGDQFKVVSAIASKQQSIQGVMNYLTKADIRGLGPVLVKKIVDAFGINTIDIIRNDWGQLKIISGISDKKARQIHDGEAQCTPLLDLLSFEGITSNKAEAIFKKYGPDAVNVLKNDTYKIVYDIDGIGFKTADRIALANGADPNGYDRVAAAITYRLNKIGDEGHCYETKDLLLKGMDEVLIPSVDAAIIENVLKNELMKGSVIGDGDAIYSSKLYMVENDVSSCICSLTGKTTAENNPPLVRCTIKCMEEKISSERGYDFEYEEQQCQAIEMGLQNRLSVITGGAGTGKTTIARAIANAFIKNGDFIHERRNVILCAPTGKAAKRMEEAIGLSASTIHRLVLRYQSGDNDEIEDYAASRNMIICDEASMLDMHIADMLLRFAIKTDSNLVFIGDVHQLPPVGPGMFFRDLLKCAYVPKTELTFCHRQQGNIAINAYHVNLGFSPKALIYDNTTTRYVKADKNEAVRAILGEYDRLIKKYGIENVCVIGPMKKSGKSPTSTSDLNILLRRQANDKEPADSCKFAPGDRVMNLKNDKENDIYNGDVGTVIYSSREENELMIDINGRRRLFTLSKQEQFDLAYAMTVHKSQGSEYDAVIFACCMDHAFMLERNLIYTAITRAKKEMVIVGETQALAMAIKTTKAISRRTKMLERINAKFAQDIIPEQKLTPAVSYSER